MDWEEERQKSFYEVDRRDNERLEDSFAPALVYRALGFTREMLRYYEKLGLIRPRQSEENGYRAFSLSEVEKLLAIDLYRRRGFSASELQGLLNADPAAAGRQYAEKADDLRRQIAEQERLLALVEKDRALLEALPRELGQFRVREDLPLYRVVDRLPAFTSFEEYGEHLTARLRPGEEALLSRMFRVVEVDEHRGYLNSCICVVERAEKREPDGEYLHSGRCLYTVVETSEGDLGIMERMFRRTQAWRERHGQGLKMNGVVYIQPRLLMPSGPQGRGYCETFIPLE